MKLQGKTALITGSSRGIGQQIAFGLAEEGANIIVHGRTRSNCENTLKMLQTFDVQVFTVYGNLTYENAVKEIIEQLDNLNLQVDILYNNAAIMTPYKEDYLNHDYELWLESYLVNVVALYELCSVYIPKMINNGYGRIINLTSRISNIPELAPYATSKWAVDKLTEDLSFKLKDTPVRINVLDPSWIRTDMGGINADYAVEEVLPGALHPALIDNDGPNGMFYSAIDQKWCEIRNKMDLI